MNFNWKRGLALLGLMPGLSLACACGCGVFDVGTNSMFASHAGGMVYVEYDFLDQSRNWSGTSSAPADNNEDKQVRTAFNTLGGHYMFNRKWGVSVELPYWRRHFVHNDEASGEQLVDDHGAIGDIRLKAIYTGFSEDMSSGLTFGVKLANGDSSFPGFDADTQIGTGSTDLLLGYYHLGRLSQDNRWSYFIQGQLDTPVEHKTDYRPGAEVAASGGIYFEGWKSAGGLRFSPVGQLRAIHHQPDGGAAAFPDDTGYTRLLVAPGFEIAKGGTRIYADVALPAYTQVRGNQLVAPVLWKLNVSHNF